MNIIVVGLTKTEHKWLAQKLKDGGWKDIQVTQKIWGKTKDTNLISFWFEDDYQMKERYWEKMGRPVVFRLHGVKTQLPLAHDVLDAEIAYDLIMRDYYVV